MKLKHICEVCGKEEIMEPEEAYTSGWDYPPKMGVFGVLSPRTCGSCAIDSTIWWRLQIKEVSADSFSEKDMETLNRIINEPSSIEVK